MKVKTAIKEAPFHIMINVLFLLLGVSTYSFAEYKIFKIVAAIVSIVSIIAILMEIANVVYLKNKAKEEPGYLDKKLY